MKKVLSVLLVIGALFATPFVMGEYNILFKKTIIKRSKDVDRKIYETSKSYIKGASQDLAKYQFEYYNTLDADEKIAIQQLVLNRFSDLEASQLNNTSLKQFLIKMRGY